MAAMCSDDDCDRPVVARGMCPLHWARQRKTERPPCTIEGCARPQNSRGWCNSHYLRWRKHGDPLAGNPGPRARRALDHADGTRTCFDCGSRKPLEQFPRDRNASLGHRSNCKPCHTVKANAWYAANTERAKARIRAHADANRDEIRRKDKERYERDKVKRVAYAVEQVHRRRALIALAPFEPGITVLRLRRRLGDRCCYCQTVMDFTPKTGREYRPCKATLEHVVPLSRGGGHTWQNVVLACWQCNVRKNAKLVSEWETDTIAAADEPEQLLLWAS